MSRSSNTFIDFDGTLVYENSSRLLIEALLRRAETRPERWLAGMLSGPLQRVARLGLEIVGRVTGDRDLALIVVAWAFKQTLVTRRDALAAEVAGQLTLNRSLADVYQYPFSIASAGLRPIIEQFLKLHPTLKVVKIYSSELSVKGPKLQLKLLTLRGKLRVLRNNGADSYFTDYDREARLFGRRQAGNFELTVLPGTHGNTIFHLEGRS